MPTPSKYRRRPGMPEDARADIAARHAAAAGGAFRPLFGTAPSTMRLAELAPNPNNPVRDQDAAELVPSIQRVGILQPLLVTARPAFLAAYPHHADLIDAQATHVVIDGHRRLRAAHLAELDEVPVFIREDVSEGGADALIRVIANDTGKNLNPIHLAQAYTELTTVHGRGVRELARELGTSPGQISKIMQLLDLPPQVQTALEAGTIPAAAGVAMRPLDEPARLAMLERLTAGDSVREALATVTPQPQPVPEPAQRPAAEIETTLPTQRDPAPQPNPDADRDQIAREKALVARNAACAKIAAAGTGHDPHTLARHILTGRAITPAVLRLARSWLAADTPPAADPTTWVAGLHGDDLTRAAHAVILAAAELRVSTPGRVWDDQDAAHLARLAAAGYKPTAWESTRLAAVPTPQSVSKGNTRP